MADTKATAKQKDMITAARKLSRAHQRTNDMVTEYAIALRELQTDWHERLNKQIEVTARAKKTLMDKMKKISDREWAAQRTHTEGCITFGLHRVPGGILISNETQTIDRLFALADEGRITRELANAVIQTKYTLRKREVGQLPAEIMALAGVQVTEGKEALYIHGEEATNIERLMKGLQKVTQQEGKAKKATALEKIGGRGD